MSIQPFTIAIPQSTLDDLQHRLAQTRWPDEAENSGWNYGTNLAYLKEEMPMKTLSITPATSDKARLGGIALASVIIALMLSLLLEALDQTIVGTAMPRIIAQLHGLDRYTWVVTAYVLASMTMVPIVDKLSDQFPSLALSGALQHGFVAVLVFALMALLASLFLKEVSFVSTSTGASKSES